MKYTIHVPVEQYGFVEVENDNFSTPEEIEEAYRETKEAFSEKSGSGLPKKEFDQFLDNYLMEARTSLSDYEKMDEAQISIIQTIKRSKARIKRLMADQELINDQGVENLMAKGE